LKKSKTLAGGRSKKRGTTTVRRTKSRNVAKKVEVVPGSLEIKTGGGWVTNDCDRKRGEEVMFGSGKVNQCLGDVGALAGIKKGGWKGLANRDKKNVRLGIDLESLREEGIVVILL